MKTGLALACVFALAQAVSRHPSAKVVRNTIFAEERLQGEIFEKVDAFTNVQLYNEEVNPYRLPNTTKPSHYRIFWNINMTSHTYSGKVEIELEATQPGVNEIVIHSDYTELSNVHLTQGSTSINITYRLESDYQFLRIRPYIDLEYNADSRIIYTLSIDFEAKMRKDMYGIYESWFRTNTSDLTSELSWMASTQFQATAARYAFPCYDEPSFKATFDITIRRPSSHNSWSCTLKTGRRDDTIPPVAGYEVDVYHTTPIMSTYLLALIVADYETMEHINDDGKLLYEVIAREQAISAGQGEYAYNVGRNLLDKMNDHTNFNFYEMNPNLKMTQAAIPDFSAGAMENWGLLTYREAYLMYDADDTNSFNKQLIAYILSHEIAHMWFGNYVTNDWWDVLWLNEGFARYYQYFLTHMVEYEMKFDTRFIVEQVHTALLADSADNAHPLTNPGVGSPQEVSNMFNTLSYNKGASIIRQTELFLGSDVHREGLRNYLQYKGNQTAKPIDLFSQLEKVANEREALAAYGPEFNFIEYYKSWTEQPGHPVLNVNVNHATGRMTITQRRFSINSGLSDVPTSYIVPITFATASDPDFNDTKPSHILTDMVTIINRGSIGDEWVIFNKQQSGFYRVNYDYYTWDLITLALRGSDRTRIHEHNRAQIVNDLFQFARSGLMSYNRALSILAFLENETEYAPWFAAITGFNWLRNRLASSPTQLARLDALITRLAGTVMTTLTYEPREPREDFIVSYLRYQLAPVMCNAQVSACISAATRQFLDLKNNNETVPVDSRNWVYCNAIRHGSIQDFNFLRDRFLTHNVYTEKILLLQSLGCTNNSESLTYILDNIIVNDTYVIRPQDYTTAFNSAVSGNEENTLLVFAYVQSNLVQIIKAFRSASIPLAFISSRLRNAEQVLEFQIWANSSRAELGDDYENVYNNAAITLQSIQWTEGIFSDLDDYFNGEDPIFSTSSTTTTTTAPLIPTEPGLLVSPVTPDLSSAASNFVSLFLLSLGIIIHLYV